MTIELNVLGGFGVSVDGREIDDLKGRPTCGAALVYLGTEGRVTRDSLVAVLWPERPEGRARHALSQTLYQLRKSLGREWLERRGQELRLSRDVSVDAVEFGNAVREGRLEEGVRMYAGRFLEGWHLRSTASFEHWVDRQAERLASRFREACRRSIATHKAADDGAGALALARHWADVEPDRPEAHQELIGLLVRGGEYEAARECYAALERRLAERGVVPGPEVVAAAAPARAPRKPPWSEDLEGRRRIPHPRMVVLPFTHVGERRYSHLTDGLVDETTARLSRHPGLRVIARSSASKLADESHSPVEIGRALKVDYVFGGTVRWRPAGASATGSITPRLVRATDGTQVWAGRFEIDATRVATVHIQLAEATLGALGLPSLPTRNGATTPDAGDPEAYEFFVRGLQHWHQRSPAGLKAAIDLFIKAIRIHEAYARAYAGLALAYAMLPSFVGEAASTWLPRARRAAERALELDPNVVEGHMAMGIIAWNQELDASAAGRSWDQALVLEPSNAQTLLWHAYRSAALGRPEQARRRTDEALALDPLSVSTNFDAGFVHWELRDRTQALTQMRRVLQLDPAFTPAAWVLGAHHLQRGELSDARREWARIKMFGSLWGELLEHLDEPARVVSAVDRIVEFSPLPVHWYATASLYVLFDAPERALFWIENHFRNLKGGRVTFPTGGPSLFHLATDPLFDPLRSTTRYQALARALQLDPPTV